MLFEFFTAYRNLKKNMAGIERARHLDPVMAAYRAGQYGRALALNTDPFLRAEILIQLDRAAEGEQVLRQMAAIEQQPKLMALIQSSLGNVLMFQKRYDEAMECFQRALGSWPERGSTHRAIAEYWLRRGDNPAEALRWARLAVEKENAGPGLSEDSKAICLGEDLATLAWAVAVHLKDGAEVDRLSELVAFPAITPMSSLAMSSFHFGMAWAALGDASRSAIYFELTLSRDRTGVWGREAASMMATSPK
ncbi:MAG TPA: tetratricopeptide repeat protein [Bryobacteraceae bacterium]|nr:tetratricopeptide repeat protein [Bryobacteraceae bacterium]